MLSISILSLAWGSTLFQVRLYRSQLVWATFALPIPEVKWFYRDFTQGTAVVFLLRCKLNLIAFAMMVSALKSDFFGRFCHRVDRVHSLRKILTRLRGMNFCSNLANFAPSQIRQPNSPKCTQIVQNAPNMSLGSNGVDRVRLLRKIPTRLRGTNFCTNSALFAPIFVMQPNSPKCTQIVQNVPKHHFTVQWVDRVPLL